MLLAAAHPALELRAITTVAGNGPLDKVTLNARRVCTLAGIRGVPIAAGAEGPRDGVLEPAADVHGESALDGPELPEPDVPLDARPAVELIADELAAAAEPVTLFATGPLTNVAAALERVERERIREVVWMGGSTERGNRTPYAEFNAWVDPDAAAAVLASGVPFTMVGLNLTHQARATPEVIARMHALGTPLGETVAGWFEFFGATYRTLFGADAPPVHDPCAVALRRRAGRRALRRRVPGDRDRGPLDARRDRRRPARALRPRAERARSRWSSTPRASGTSSSGRSSGSGGRDRLTPAQGLRAKRATSGTTTRWIAGGGEHITVSSLKRFARSAIQAAPRRLVGMLRPL